LVLCDLCVSAVNFDRGALSTPYSGLGPVIGRGRTAEIYEWGEGRVLKLFVAGWPEAAVELEARVSRAVHDTGLPTPAVGEVLQVGGRPGLVLERVSGPSMLQVLSSRPWTMPRLLPVFAWLHAGMHRHEAPDLPSQRSRLGAQIERARPLPIRLKERALRRLDALPDGSAICHGDFHPDNVLVTSDGPVIIDWDNATSGNPLADVARTSLLFRTGAPLPGRASRLLVESLRSLAHRTYLRRYRQARPFRQEELDAWLLPIAAARLSEGIVEEEPDLLALVEALASRAG
jgi:thiamine kinase